MATPVKPTASPKPVADDELKHKTPNGALVQKQQEWLHTIYPPQMIVTYEPHSLLRTGDRSDCTIKCNGKEWRAHTCILCPRSAYFGRALGGNFQASQTCLKQYLHLTWDSFNRKVQLAFSRLKRKKHTLLRVCCCTCTPTTIQSGQIGQKPRKCVG
jgi:BTB/POZ domain